MSGILDKTSVKIGQAVLLVSLLLSLFPGCAGIFRTNTFRANTLQESSLIFRAAEQINEERSAISMIRISPDGSILVVGYAPENTTSQTQEETESGLLTQVVKLWSLHSEIPQLLGIKHFPKPTDLKVEFQRDEKTLVLAESRGLYLVDVSEPKTIETAVFQPFSNQEMQLLSQNGKWVVTVSPQGEWSVIDVKTLERQITLPEEIEQVLAISPSGKLLAVRQKRFNAPNEKEQISIWDISDNRRTGGMLVKLSEISLDFGINVELCQFSLDDHIFACVGFNNSVQLWNVKTGKSPMSYGHDSTISQFIFGPSTTGNRLVVSTFGKKANLCLVKVTIPENGYPGFFDDQSLKREESLRTMAITALCFNADGSVLYAGDCEGNINQWVITD